VVSSPYIYFARIKSSVSINETSTIDLNANECDATQDYYSSDLILVLGDSIAYCIIPFLLSFIFSIISLGLLCSNNKLKKNEIELLRMVSIDEATNQYDHKEQRNSSSNIKLTVMLMSLPISYLITALPIFIIVLLQFFLIGNRTFNENESELAIAKMLMYINSSINILFYIFLGKSLRKDFLEILPIGILSHM
jgi:hypothetical protein